MRQRYSGPRIPMIDTFVAQDRALQGDFDGAIELSRAAVNELIDGGAVIFAPHGHQCPRRGLAAARDDGDIEEAQIGDRPISRSGDRTRARPVRNLAAANAGTAGTGQGDDAAYRELPRSLPKDGQQNSALRATWRWPRRWIRTPAGGGAPKAAPSRSERPKTAASPRRMACPPTGLMSARRFPSNPHGTTAAGWPVTLNSAWNGTRAPPASASATHLASGKPRCATGPIAVPGVITTSTSS